jgi:SAM-dependent methyltransferase
MNIVDRTANFLVAALKSYGPSSAKKILWDKEFSGTKWNFIDNTVGDCVYPILEKYAKNGSILDVGCGPGNTANELTATAYESYVGVDISEAALEKAQKRTIESGRVGKNTFFQGDFIEYEPNQKFDVILFRESMYHVPMGRIKDTLDRYAKYLKSRGVFIVRIATSDKNSKGKDKPRPAAMVRIMEDEFDVVEKNVYEGVARPTVLVFRPTHSD